MLVILFITNLHNCFIAFLYTYSKKMLQYKLMIIKLSHINEVCINEQIP